MGYRWRRMYNLTGLPGWMRFGYSPGWQDRSPTGTPPGAEFIRSRGLMPQFQDYLRNASTLPMGPTGPLQAPVNKEQEIVMLEEQAKNIESQLQATKKRLEDARNRPETQKDYRPYYPWQPYDLQSTAYGQYDVKDELASLNDYRKQLDQEIEGVEARIEDLKKLRDKEATDKGEGD